MNHTIFSVAYIAICAAAGLYTGNSIAWKFAAFTAVLAFLADELRLAEYSFALSGKGEKAGTVIAVISWLTGAIAGFSLLF